MIRKGRKRSKNSTNDRLFFVRPLSLSIFHVLFHAAFNGPSVAWSARKHMPPMSRTGESTPCNAM